MLGLRTQYFLGHHHFYTATRYTETAMRAQLVESAVPFPSGPPRTPGVHVSGIIKALAVDYGLLDRKWVPEDFDLVDFTESGASGDEWWASLDADSQVRMAIGMAWEQWYLPRIPNVVYQPGELELDGIYLTLDGESLDTIVTQRNPSRVVLAIHEVKTTSKSINTTGDLSAPNPKNWLWLTQAKAYAKARRARTIYLHILYLYGDYSRPFKPQLHVWRLEFEQWEIDETWETIVDYLRQQRASGRVA